MQLYFAYGSNLLESQMKARCPEHRFQSLAALHDYRFLIGERGYATITPAVGHAVHGVVYSLSESDEATLDRSEGVAIGCYEKHYLSVVGSDSTMRDVLVYIDRRTAPSLPLDDYMAKILSGASAFGLPSDYQRFLRSFFVE